MPIITEGKRKKGGGEEETGRGGEGERRGGTVRQRELVREGKGERVERERKRERENYPDTI